MLCDDQLKALLNWAQKLIEFKRQLIVTYKIQVFDMNQKLTKEDTRELGVTFRKMLTIVIHICLILSSNFRCNDNY